MSTLEWSFVIAWPIVVVLINNFLVHLQMKHMANVTCQSFHKTGKALMLMMNSIRGIEKVLAARGIEVPSPIDSKSENDLSWIAR